MKQAIFIWLNLFINFWVVPLIKLSRIRFMNKSLVLLGMVLIIPYYPNPPSIPILLCIFGHLLHLSFAGCMHLKASTLTIAAWISP